MRCRRRSSPRWVAATLHEIEAQESAAHGSNEALYGKLLALGAQLAEYGNRLARQHAAEMNAQAWPLTQVRWVPQALRDQRVIRMLPVLTVANFLLGQACHIYCVHADRQGVSGDW